MGFQIGRQLHPMHRAHVGTIRGQGMAGRPGVGQRLEFAGAQGVAPRLQADLRRVDLLGEGGRRLLHLELRDRRPEVDGRLDHWRQRPVDTHHQLAEAALGEGGAQHRAHGQGDPSAVRIEVIGGIVEALAGIERLPGDDHRLAGIGAERDDQIGLAAQGLWRRLRGHGRRRRGTDHGWLRRQRPVLGFAPHVHVTHEHGQQDLAAVGRLERQ